MDALRRGGRHQVLSLDQPWEDGGHANPAHLVAALEAVPPFPPSLGFRACEAETMASATTTTTVAGPFLIV